jgi:hypothetical protein
LLDCLLDLGNGVGLIWPQLTIGIGHHRINGTIKYA